MVSPLSHTDDSERYRASYALMALALFAGMVMRIVCLDGKIFGHAVNTLDIGYFIRYYRWMDMDPAYFLSHNLTKISSLYLYFWLYLSHMQPLPPMLSVKLGSCFFDLMCSFWAWRIVALWYPLPSLKPALAASALFISPALWLNSSLWGQVDSTYIAWLLGFLFFLIRSLSPAARKNDIWMACFMYAIGINFKLQAIFLLPALAWLLGKGVLRANHFIFIACMYVFIQLPRYILGLPASELFSAYGKQVAVNSATVRYDAYCNLFSLPGFPSIGNPTLFYIGVAALCGFTLAAYLTARNKPSAVNTHAVLWVLLLSALWTPFFMTSIFERYYLLAITVITVMAFRYRQLALPALLLHVAISLEYMDYLYDYTIVSNSLFSLIVGACGLWLIHIRRKAAPAGM